jgi:hypothetical protein
MKPAVPPEMGEYDPTELVGICDSMLDFGEVTENEAYNLADWLNKHDEACLHWPGEELIRPLQEIWADGKVTRTELRRLTGLIRGIHKEWTKIQFDESMQRAGQQVEELPPKMPPSEPKLPPIDLTLRIKSHTQPDVRYDVDLSGPSCTCPDQRHGSPSLQKQPLFRQYSALKCSNIVRKVSEKVTLKDFNLSLDALAMRP